MSSTRQIPLKTIGLYVACLVVVYQLPGLYGVQSSGLGFTVFALFGGTGILFGLSNLDEVRRMMLVRNTPTRTVRALAVGDAEVKGTARPAGDPLEAPISGILACLYELEIQTATQEDSEEDWRTRFTYRGNAPFLLDDGTGTVRVEPDGAELRLQEETTLEVPEGEGPPERLATWTDGRNFLDPKAVGQARSAEGYEAVDTSLDIEGIEEGSRETVSVGDVTGALASAAGPGSEGAPDPELLQRVQNARSYEVAGSSRSDRRFVERVLEVDEDAYVLGGAQRREGASSTENVENLVMRGHRGTGYFLVSDRPEDDIVSQGQEGLWGHVGLMAGLLFAASVGLVAHLTTIL